jgi:hypothetical protein
MMELRTRHGPSWRSWRDRGVEDRAWSQSEKLAKDHNSGVKVLMRCGSAVESWSKHGKVEVSMEDRSRQLTGGERGGTDTACGVLRECSGRKGKGGI